jgi:nucleoside-diphosphate-sugar epimerase
MKNILITGSQSYIGSVLTSFLEERGFNCVGYDTGLFRNCLLYDPPATRTVFKDMWDFEEDDLQGIDAVVHLAALSNDPVGNLDAARMYEPTRQYAFEIAKHCRKRGVKFIFASSCSIYGKGKGEFLAEDSPTDPQTAYSLNKLQIEQDLRSIADKEFSPIALRFATVFGLSPRMRFDLAINAFVGMAAVTRKILLNSDGSAWRPNVHVLDICQAVRCAIDHDWRGGQLLVLNVGDEENNLQIIDIAKTVQSLVPGCELKFLQQNPELDSNNLIRAKAHSGVDTRTYKVSFAKIRQTFKDFRIAWSVEKGIEDLLQKLKAMNLDEATFKDRRFYRVPMIEHLLKSGYLSEDLRWLRTI